MSYISGVNSQDLNLLNTAYEIKSYIDQSFHEAGLKKHGEDYDIHFKRQPMTFNHFSPVSQTNQGFIIQHLGGNIIPWRLITPHGIWNFDIDSNSGTRKIQVETSEKIKIELGLKLVHEVVHNSLGAIGPWYTITKWNGKEIPEAIPREYKEYLTEKKIKDVWNAFVESHPNYKLIKS